MPIRVFLAFVSVFAILLAGCGGGGGGGGSAPGPVQNARLAILLDATRKVASRPDGQSIRTLLLDARGTTLDSRVDDLASGTRSIAFDRLFPGLYTLRAELNSEPGFGGSLVAVLESRIQVNDDRAAATIAIGAAPTAVRVTPATLQLTIGAAGELSATPVIADGALTFPALDSVTTWRTDRDAISVSPSGVVSGLARGGATVTATIDGVSGTAGVTVADTGPPARNPFTLLVYMNAANDRFPAALAALNAMERATNGNLRIVVQLKQSRTLFPGASFDGTRRLLVRRDDSDAIASGIVSDLGTGVDMGDPNTLRGFIDWARERYAADRYALVVWGTGNGWGPIDAGRDAVFDDEFGSSITPAEFGSALNGRSFRFLAFDLSFGMNIETLFSVQAAAPAIVGVTGPMPTEGFDYVAALRPIASNPNLAVNAAVTGFVDTLVASRSGLPVTASAIDTARFNGAITALNRFCDAAIAVPDAEGLASFGTAVGRVETLQGRTDRDLGTIARTVAADSDAAAPLRSAAQALVSALDPMIIRAARTASSPLPDTGLSIETSGVTGTQYLATPFGAQTRWRPLFIAMESQ